MLPVFSLTETIRHLRFRYWDGSNWLEGWDRPEAPLGVEITLGFEPPPEEDFVAGNVDENLPPPDYPFEVFRRLGARTRGEIDAERTAIKALRGDFDGLSEDSAAPHQATEGALKAAGRR